MGAVPNFIMLTARTRAELPFFSLSRYQQRRFFQRDFPGSTNHLGPTWFHDDSPRITLTPLVLEGNRSIMVSFFGILWKFGTENAKNFV
jgi:hypothetical protein